MLNEIDLLIASFNLPAPCREYRFCERRWRFDYAWVEKRLALEIEGGGWVNGRHHRPKGYEADLEKYNRATVLGWRVIRATPQMMKRGDVDQMLIDAYHLGSV